MIHLSKKFGGWLGGGTVVTMTRRKMGLTGAIVGCVIAILIIVSAFALKSIFSERDDRQKHEFAQAQRERAGIRRDAATAKKIAILAKRETEPISKRRLILTIRKCIQSGRCRAVVRQLNRRSGVIVVSGSTVVSELPSRSHSGSSTASPAPRGSRPPRRGGSSQPSSQPQSGGGGSSPAPSASSPSGGSAGGSNGGPVNVDTSHLPVVGPATGGVRVCTGIVNVNCP